MGYLHDERLAHIEANIEQMQEDERAHREREKADRAAQEANVDNLVEAIRKLIDRIPPENLR